MVLILISYVSLLNLVIGLLNSLEYINLEDFQERRILSPWVTPSPFRFNCPFPSPLTPPYVTDSPPYIPMSPEYRLASLTPPPLSPPLENLLLQTPSPISPLALSLEDIQLPPHPTSSAKQVRKKSTPKKKNVRQRLHLKKVFKDYLKEFGAEEVEEEVMEQLGCSLKGRRSSGPCKACWAGGWCNNLHHCYQAMGEAGGSNGF